MHGNSNSHSNIRSNGRTPSRPSLPRPAAPRRSSAAGPRCARPSRSGAVRRGAARCGAFCALLCYLGRCCRCVVRFCHVEALSACTRVYTFVLSYTIAAAAATTTTTTTAATTTTTTTTAATTTTTTTDKHNTNHDNGNSMP